jgi:hypothetical protein
VTVLADPRASSWSDPEHQGQESDGAVSLESKIDGDTRRWPAKALGRDKGHPLEGSICATVWPTESLQSADRWFDELYLWTEGFHASTTQRARIQWAALRAAFHMLEGEDVKCVAVTLSFGTVERTMDHLVDAFEAHRLVAHRMAIVLRGSLVRLRSRYRIRAFRELLRGQHVPVGYLPTAPSVSMELKSLELVQPDFAKLAAPASTRIEPWQALVFEARVAGVPADRLIVSGLQSRKQVDIALQAGIPFGQGKAVRPAFAPPPFTWVGASMM